MNADLERKIDLLREKIVAEVKRDGGSLRSNMAEPLYFAPGPPKIPDGLPPEEVARRKRAAADVYRILKKLRSRAKK